MKTFKEGDRVNHPRYGAGTVVQPFNGTGWPTVKFDSGDHVMCADDMLSAVRPNPTDRFKIGDRVHHAQHGSATVLYVEDHLNLVTIHPDFYRDGSTASVHPISLTHESPGPKFKIGDRVSHPLHRDGTVEEYSERSGLYTVDVGRGQIYRALEHQITPAVPEPTYHICIEEITGAAHVPGNLTAKEVANYINDSVNWRVVQEIKITKEG